ncbi:hypothetical protein HMPREF1584_01390 [Gardnerella vaginalis JCP8481A]|nr:hypothetical protein HMPREF1584_01390 [Gardnerella vaginalis JCP8481A]
MRCLHLLLCYLLAFAYVSICSSSAQIILVQLTPWCLFHVTSMCVRNVCRSNFLIQLRVYCRVTVKESYVYASRKC